MLFSCRDKEKTYLIEDRQKITNIVYSLLYPEDSSTESLSSKRNTTVNDDNNIRYSYLEIVAAQQFNIEVKGSLTPYFEPNESGIVELDCIMAELDITPVGQFYLEDHYRTHILILSSNDVHYGFLSTHLSKKYHGYHSEFLSPYLYDNYNFGSHIFLSDNTIINYYQKGDEAYSFTVNLFKGEAKYPNFNDNVIESISLRNIEKTEIEVDYFGETFRHIEPQMAYDFIAGMKVEKVVFSALVTGNEGTDRILVTSTECPSIRSFTCNDILDINGNKVPYFDYTKIKVVRLYYYKRDPNFIPVNLSVYSVIVLQMEPFS
jgi:hypothetical protein